MSGSAAPHYRRNVKDTSSMLEDGRRRREATSVRLRDERKMDSLQKRRAMQEEDGASSAAAPEALVLMNVPADIKVEHIPAYCSAIRSDVVQLQLEGVVQLRKLLAKEAHPPVASIIDCGILPVLVRLLASPDPRMQFESAWAITNIASTDYTAAVVEAGAIPQLAVGLLSADANVREQCLWCLGNIVGDCVQFRDMVLYTPGALQGMLANISQPSSAGLLRNAAWAMSNFCRGKPSPSTEAVAAMLPALAHLLTSSDKEVLADACWGISYLTDNEKLLDTVLTANILGRVVDIMGHNEVAIQLATLRLVGNFISGNEKHTQAAIDSGALRALIPLLSSSKRNIRREATWAVSNVAAGTKEQITILMTLPGIMPAVLHQLKDADWNIRKEAAWVVCNVAAAGTSDHVRQLVAMGVIAPLNDVLSTNDPRMLCVVLDAIAAILTTGKKLCDAGLAAACDFAGMFEEVGLLNRLEELQDHDHADVTNKCIDLIERFYGVSEGDENTAAPATPQQPSFNAFAHGAAGFTTPTSLFKSFGSAAAPFGAALPSNFPPMTFSSPAQTAKSVAALPALAGPATMTGIMIPALSTDMAPHASSGVSMPNGLYAPTSGASFDFSNVSFV